ncbi:MAG: CocE/NonD family hydrolase, partial [Pseudomonadota bacterium]
MKKSIKAVKLVLAVLTGMVVAGMLVFTAAGLMPVNEDLPYSRQSTYVEMKDGTRLAVRYILPSGTERGEKVPAVMETTRYVTEYKKTFLLNALLNLKIARLAPETTKTVFLEAGYAIVEVDARGSGASEGTRDMEFSKEEISDMGELVEWTTSQEWSNGKVGAYGISYSGNTAELAAVTHNPGLAAAAMLYPDFDVMRQSAFPGGIFNEYLCREWNKANQAMDANKVKGLFGGGIAPVGGDTDEKLLGTAIAGHNTMDMYKALNRITYFDEDLTPEYKASALSPFSYRKQIEGSGIPMYVRVGWQDSATVNGAIERFLTYSNKQTLVIGPWSHGGSYFSDPFLQKDISRQELEKAQAEEVITFFDKYLKAENGKKETEGNIIRYYTFGEGQWKTTDTWPVKGFENRRLYFKSGNGLSVSKPMEASGSDSYKVDFTATTGESNRWRTNLGGGRIAYPDRAEEDKKLLVYTSEALTEDVEITGVPVVTLNLYSTAEDGAFYVYLEDV